jgi:hypothetical protein
MLSKGLIGTSCDGHRVHIDIVSALKFGPGREYHECRIFVDGRLAGRGGDCGCSLGFGGSDLPSVAAVGRDAAVTVDLLPGDPVVELWQAHLIGREGSETGTPAPVQGVSVGTQDSDKGWVITNSS